jgi:hypothetical protein
VEGHRSATGQEEVTTTYSDIAQIRTVMLNEPTIFDDQDFLIQDLAEKIAKTHEKT